jgi:hypothetical protein
VSEKSAGLRERLEEIGRRLAVWNGAVDGHFQSLWSFNSAPKGAFERSLLEAARTAQQRAGTGPREEGYTLLAEVCDFDAGATDAERADLARVVKASNHLAVLCLWFAGRACQLLDATGGPEWLRRAVTAAALADTEPDYRDWYLTLGEVWSVAVRQGLDPRGAFAAASAVAPEKREVGGGSTRKMLGEFEKSAYFAESVAPKLRDPNSKR